MFRLTKEEKQEVVTVCDHLEKIKYSNALPYVFSEHGAIMLANVLNPESAIEMSIHVVRAFVRLRGVVANHKAIAQKFLEIERKVTGHDQQIRALFDAIRELMKPPCKRSVQQLPTRCLYTF